MKDDKDKTKEQLIDELVPLRQIVEQLPVGLFVWEFEDPNDLGSFRMRITNTAAGEMAGVSMLHLLARRFKKASPRRWRPKCHLSMPR